MAALFLANCAFGELIAHYTFDNSNDRYQDVAGSYDGTADGSGTSFVSSGVAGLGDAMHTTASGRVLVNTPITEVSLSSFAISFWATSGSGNWYDNWISFGGTDNFFLQLSGSGPGFFLDNPANIAGYADYDVAGSVGAGLDHVVLSADSTEGLASLYINGTLVDTGIWTVSASETLGYLTIGGSRSRDGTQRNIDALIDDVQIYDKALTSDNVSSLYNTPGSAIPEPATAGLLALISAVGFFIRRRFVD